MRLAPGPELGLAGSWLHPPEQMSEVSESNVFACKSDVLHEQSMEMFCISQCSGSVVKPIAYTEKS